MKPVEYVELIRDIATADFIKIVGSENILAFTKYVQKIQDSNQDKIVLRLYQQIPNSDGVPTPFYLWVSFLMEDESAEIIAPDFDDFMTYLEVPEELIGYEYFTV